MCTCPVCMTEETRARIVATPRAELPTRPIGEYSNSAHGVPCDLDDLRALLPRHQEQIADGQSADHLEIGMELSRFGQAQALDPGFLSEWQCLVYAEWGRCLLSAWPITRNILRRNNTLLYPSKMLVCGGIDAGDLLWTAEDLLAGRACLQERPAG